MTHILTRTGVNGRHASRIVQIILAWLIYILGLAFIIMQSAPPIPRLEQSANLLLLTGIALALAGLIGAFVPNQLRYAPIVVFAISVAGILNNAAVGTDHISRQNAKLRSIEGGSLYEAARNHPNAGIRDARPGYYAIRDQYRDHDIVIHNRLPLSAPSLKSLGGARSVQVDRSLKKAQLAAARYSAISEGRTPRHSHKLANGILLVVWPDDPTTRTARIVKMDEDTIWVFPVNDESAQ